jgi:hypothetical protein
MFEGAKALLRGKKMAENPKEETAKEVAAEIMGKATKKKRGPGRPKGSGKRGRPKGSKNKKKGRIGRPKKVAAAKRGPGRPKGSGKKRGRKPGRKAAVVPKGLIKKAEAKRLVKAAVAKLKATMPKVIRKELLKLLK